LRSLAPPGRKGGQERKGKVIPLKDDATPEKISAVSSTIGAFVKRFE
jgi:hypothetical protein